MGKIWKKLLGIGLITSPTIGWIITTFVRGWTPAWDMWLVGFFLWAWGVWTIVENDVEIEDGEK
jgi:putative Mn2+ efflux pump MntP